MNKNFIRTLKVFAVAAAVYTLLVLVLPFAKNGVFWLSYVYAVVALLAQAYIQQVAYRHRKALVSRLYSIPVARVGAVYLLAQMVLSLLFMLLAKSVPIWLPLLVYVLALLAAAAGLLPAEPARTEPEQ